MYTESDKRLMEEMRTRSKAGRMEALKSQLRSWLVVETEEDILKLSQASVLYASYARYAAEVGWMELNITSWGKVMALLYPKSRINGLVFYHGLRLR